MAASKESELIIDENFFFGDEDLSELIKFIESEELNKKINPTVADTHRTETSFSGTTDTSTSPFLPILNSSSSSFFAPTSRVIISETPDVEVTTQKKVFKRHFNPDLTTQERKKQIMERNRESAARHRQNQKDLIENLTGENLRLTQENKQLKSTIDALLSEKQHSLESSDDQQGLRFSPNL